MTAQSPDKPASVPSALGYAVLAHMFWGFMPLYLLLVAAVPPVEFVAWRTLFTLPICLVFIWQRQRQQELRRCLTNRKIVVTLISTSSLLAVNWIGYVWAIQNNYVYAASLGYYVLPIVMMLMGVVFLAEKLSTKQWAAVGMAAIGVGSLALGALTTLWLSLLLAVSFGIYGLLRKTVDAGPLVGLTVEAIILLPAVVGYLAWVQWSQGSTAFGRDTVETIAILAGGIMSAFPLMLFASAARALPYSLMGFMQFLAPTIVFVLGLTVFGEELRPAQLVAFIAIWSAVALFSWDIWTKNREARAAV